MIKLRNIISEIRVVPGNITPETLKRLHYEIWKDQDEENIGKEGKIWKNIPYYSQREWMDIIDEYKPNPETDKQKEMPYWEKVPIQYFPQLYKNIKKYKEKYKL